MANLVLVRHGLSTHNQKGLWTGWENPPLAKEGKNEAKKAAEAVKDIQFDLAFTSPLIRAKETLSIMLSELNQANLPIFESTALNERNYGIYTNRNKWEVKDQVGEEEFLKLRRGWDYPIPKGESLKQVFERVVPYYKKEILPRLKEGKNMLVSSSGNAIRALVKSLEGISDEDIPKVEISTGEVYVYTLDSSGNIINKEIRASNPQKI